MAATCSGVKVATNSANSVEASGVLRDVVVIDKAFADENVSDAIEQGDVGARLDGQMNVGHHGGLGNARVDDDERARFGAG